MSIKLPTYGDAPTWLEFRWRRVDGVGPVLDENGDQLGRVKVTAEGNYSGVVEWQSVRPHRSTVWWPVSTLIGSGLRVKLRNIALDVVEAAQAKNGDARVK